MNKWKLLLRQRLQDFLREFSNTCEKIGRKKNSVKIVFATKYLNREQFVAFLNIAREINMVPVTIGENRVQEAQAKFEFVKQTRPQLVGSFYPIMIGTLQKNKINKAINIFSEIHSVDSLDLARTLNKRLENIVILGSVSDSRITSSVNDSGQDGYQLVTRQARMTGRIEKKVMPVFLEVNVLGEKSKHGFAFSEIDGAIRELKLLKSLKIKGLMTMAPLTADKEEIRGVFRKLKELADKYNLLTSMGMSSDWKEAIEEGTDIMRIGGRIFK